MIILRAVDILGINYIIWVRYLTLSNSFRQWELER